MFTIEHLPSGTRLVHSQMKDRNTCSLGVFVHTGSRFEKKSIKGISHFLEHMVFKGTRRYSCRVIKTAVEGVGGYINAFTSKEATCFYVKAPYKHQLKSLDILLDMVRNPLIKSPDIEKERKVILEEIKMYRDLPHARCLNMLGENLFRGTLLQEDVIGSERTVSNIKRKDFLDYKRRMYVPSRMIVSVAGNVDIKRVRDVIRGRLKVKEGENLYKLFTHRKKPRRYVFEKRDIFQVHVAMGCPTLPYKHPDMFIQDIVNVIMGGGMSSRLFDKIREKRGLVYEISTFTKKYSDRGMFGVYLATSTKTTFKALDLILEEFAEAARNLKDRELSRAKEYIWGNILMMADSSSDRMMYMADKTLYLGKPLSLEEVKKKLFSVTRRGVVKFIKERLSPGKFCFSFVGNIDDADIRKFMRKI